MESRRGNECNRWELLLLKWAWWGKEGRQYSGGSFLCVFFFFEVWWDITMHYTRRFIRWHKKQKERVFRQAFFVTGSTVTLTLKLADSHQKFWSLARNVLLATCTRDPDLSTRNVAMLIFFTFPLYNYSPTSTFPYLSVTRKCSYLCNLAGELTTKQMWISLL